MQAWKVAIERRNGPTALVLSRQNLPVLDRTTLAAANGLRRGGYVLWQSNATPEIIIIATGSEVHIALEAGRDLQRRGISARVVSLPSWELFEAQPVAYRDEVLPANITTRISIEAGTPLGWERYVGLNGVTVGISRFGASAPGKIVYEKLGLTVQRVVDEAMKLSH
jgi:transketolase